MGKSHKTETADGVSGGQVAPPPLEERLKISWSKALQYNAKWDKENFVKFPETVHWLRQIIALICGILFGVLPITGTAGIATFLMLNTYLPYLYYTSYANVNIDDFGAQKLLFEGYQPSAALFMLAWVLVYSSTQF
mmetsp:Transcript_28644/g.48353  ORF Transcript_28644/g.48353 Transcript_28644/m.48353 type:complete len:136 (-) Transcript_28644:336-743(-)